MMVGNAAYVVGQAAMLIELAQLSTPDILGEFTLALAITTPLIMLTRLSLRELLATDAGGSYRVGDYLAVTGLTSPLALLAIWLVSALLYTPERTAVILVVGVGKVLESFSFLTYGLRQKHGRNRRVAVSLTLRGMVGVGALAAGLEGGGSLIWAVSALTLGWLLVLLVVDLPGARRLAGRRGGGSWLRPRAAVRLAWLAMPLGLSTVMISFQESLPRVLLEKVAGTFELGVFGVMGLLAQGASTVAYAVGQAASGRLGGLFVARQSSELKKLLWRVTGVCLAWGAACLLAAAAAGRQVLDVLFGSEYAPYQTLLILVMCGGVFGMAFVPISFGLIAARKLWAYLLVSGALVGTAAIGAVVLIPRFGAAGAAWSLIAAGAVRVIVALPPLRVGLRAAHSDEGSPTLVGEGPAGTSGV
jgi:O-antigen/teichoic acid export membrane protein